LLAALTQASEADIVASLATADLQTSEAAIGRTLGQAKLCADALTSGNWQLFDGVRNLQDHRAEAAQIIVRRLAEVLTSDEHVIALKGRLDELGRDAMQLLTAPAPAPAPTPVPAPSPTPGVPATTTASVTISPLSGNLEAQVVDEKQELHLSGADAVAALEELKTRVASERDLELTLSWRLLRKGTQL
jgi:hypothetical protein